MAAVEQWTLHDCEWAFNGSKTVDEDQKKSLKLREELLRECTHISAICSLDAACPGLREKIAVFQSLMNSVKD